jgi:hypothetical protein
MSRRDALALTDFQLRAIERAAAALPGAARSEFMAQVAAQLSGQPSDAAVQAVINMVLERAALGDPGECETTADATELRELLDTVTMADA